MTIKKQWMIVLIMTVVISVLLNSFVLSALMNRYFVSYYNENYQEHARQILQVAEETLTTPDYNARQLVILLQAHLSGPIVGIQLIDSEGVVLADVSRNQRGMMGGHMMRNFSQADNLTEIDNSLVMKNGKVLGELNIIRQGTLADSLEIKSFQGSLVANSGITLGVLIPFALILGYWISRRMSRDIMSTADMAIDMDLGKNTENVRSKVREIRVVQESLETLHRNLKLKKTSRKKLIDELVHQTRTPLTILSTHLEGFRDGVINVTDEELQKCQIQIENLNEIIRNMSNMIDAEGELDKVQMENLEISGLIRLVAEGLKAQFDLKGIRFTWQQDPKIWVVTDRYKLSQSIYNLITNGYKYTDSGGTVTIDYKVLDTKEDHLLEIVVADTGRGILAENLERIFDAYYRERGNDEVEGEGIGLYVAAQNLKQIGGSILAESRIGEGSRFTIRIPVDQKQSL
jgi:signal transduction histidine kinase